GTFTALSAGGFHTCGIRTNGAVACWGQNGAGQADAPAGTFTAVGSGGAHTCGIRTNGSIACWGRDNFGQTTPPAGTFAAVSAGADHTCGMRTNGTATCWGDNGSGQSTPPAGFASPTQDFVTGTAQHRGADPPFPVIEVQINARSDATGARPRGQLSVKNNPTIPSYRARVTCLSVAGNKATVGTEIVESTDPAQEGKGQLWSVVDGAGSGAPDRIAGYHMTPMPPLSCPPLSFNVPVISGGYAVHNATP
ncbi:MAG: RCC1 domain-containing protein, partial [Actinomycetota bacterium]